MVAVADRFGRFLVKTVLAHLRPSLPALVRLSPNATSIVVACPGCLFTTEIAEHAAMLTNHLGMGFFHKDLCGLCVLRGECLLP
jgi:hypothetical protein